MLNNTVMQYQESYQVSLIATCTSINRIGQKLRPARGCHFFRTVLSIPNLEKVFDRLLFLSIIFCEKIRFIGKSLNLINQIVFNITIITILYYSIRRIESIFCN